MTGFASLRRRIALAGGWPVHGGADALHARPDSTGYRVATLVDPPLRHVALAGPVAWREPVAFLDGTQRTELLGYVDTMPVLGATVRAAVRLRRDRQFTLACDTVHHLVVARRDALDALTGVSGDVEAVEILGDDVPHPVHDVDLARAAVDRARTTAEISVARTFRRTHPDTWLVVDGGLSTSPELSGDARAIGVVKSHAMLPFQGAELTTYVTLPAGHRTSLFAPQRSQLTPVYAWALRLHDPAGHDLFHGLLRIEIAADDSALAMADDISCHLLAERAPLSNDPRADRLIYGIHDVERFLRARGA